MVSDEEMNAFQAAMREYAHKKMERLERRLKKFAKIYFGEPVAIIYAKKGAVVETADGEKAYIEPEGGTP